VNLPHAYFYGKWRRKVPTVFLRTPDSPQTDCVGSGIATGQQSRPRTGKLLSCLSRTRGERAAEIAQFVVHIGGIRNCLSDFITQ
jgi:hypothetical protein